MNKNFSWDYEETNNPYYQIFSITSKADDVLEESLCLYIQRTDTNDNIIKKIIEKLEELIE